MKQTLELLKKEPMTIKMILGKDYYDMTKRNVTQRQLKSCVDFKEVLRVNVCSRLVLYYPFEKDYNLLVAKKRVYLVKGKCETLLNAVRFKETYILDSNVWQPLTKTIYLNDLDLVL